MPPRNPIKLKAPSGRTYRTMDRVEADHLIRTAGYQDVTPAPKAARAPRNRAAKAPRNMAAQAPQDKAPEGPTDGPPAA